jgi:glycosyltransferase involved in cell wall biosynthesis
VDEVLAPSVFAAELLARHGLRREVVVLAHGIDAPEPRPLPDGPPRVAFFGTDLPSKGLDVLLRCWRALDGALPPLQVWGPIRPAAGAPAEFHGPYRPEDLPRLLSLQSIVAVPSLWPENRPFVVDEAHAAGRPVVASRIGGLPELVRDDVDGRLLPPGDLGSWTETFRSLARAPETVLRWAQAVRRPSGVAGFAAAHRRAYLRALS